MKYAAVMGLATTNKTKAEFVSAMKFNQSILPYVTNVGVRINQLVLTLSEALYDGANAVANNTDLKAKFTQLTAQ